MGYPLHEQAERSTTPSAAANCPAEDSLPGGTRRAPNSFRPVSNPQPSLDELGGPEASWAEWTRSIRRNLRQRAEVYHTNAPTAEQDEEAVASGDQSGASEEAQSSPEGPGRRKKLVPRHKFTLRLGYDPRVFLEDPALRGQQLTPEAQAWAREFRRRIPISTDLQLARRLEPEAGRLAGAQPIPGTATTTDAATGPQHPLSSSDDEVNDDENTIWIYGRHLHNRARARRSPDEPHVRLYVLEHLAQDASFANASIQDRLSRMGEAISAATRELSRADLPARDRDRMLQWHVRRVERLQQMREEHRNRNQRQAGTGSSMQQPVNGFEG